MILLRHQQYPLLIIYKDPKESWDDRMADIVKKDIEKNDFDRFTELSADQLAVFLQSAKMSRECKE